MGTAIAIRYSCKRPQFGEKMIMEYITQQRRLLPGLATTYAMQVSMARLRVSHAASTMLWFIAVSGRQNPLLLNADLVIGG